MVDSGMADRAEGPGGCEFVLTKGGHQAIDRVLTARRAGLTELLDGWDPEVHPELAEMVRQLARELLADDKKLLADAIPSVAGQPASATSHTARVLGRQPALESSGNAGLPAR